MQSIFIKLLISLVFLVFSNFTFAVVQPINDIILGSWITTIDGEKQLVNFKQDVVEVTLLEHGVVTKLIGSYIVNNNTVRIAWNDDIFGLANYVAKIIPISAGKFKALDLDTGVSAYFIKRS